MTESRDEAFERIQGELENLFDNRIKIEHLGKETGHQLKVHVSNRIVVTAEEIAEVKRILNATRLQVYKEFDDPYDSDQHFVFEKDH